MTADTPAIEAVENRPARRMRFPVAIVCAVIAIATLATYANVRNFHFIQFDDPYYPLNSHLSDGFTAEAVKWAFTTGDQANWHPLTWLSHLLDYQLYGPQPGPDHVSGLAIHVLASLMLFFFLRRATGTLWRSGFAAFVFALHPLHVESVAWVSERKDVLCALFWFLTCWFWTRYAERPSWGPYLAALAPFCLGLLSKPMIVTLPLVLILLDLWPLRRVLSIRLLVEKIPFVVLSAAASIITFLVQQSAGAMKSETQFPIPLRIENALITWMIYLGKTFWPSNLPFFYPYPKTIPVWEAALSAAAIAAISIAVIWWFRKAPYLAVGWFWYLGSLVPVIGLVQVGNQARADRYMYIPMVGLTIMLGWGAADIAQRWPRYRAVLAGALGVLCAAMIPVTWKQVQYWETNESLFAHAILVTNDNYIAYHNLGVALRLTPGHLSEALTNFDAELRADPHSAEGHNDRGEALWKMGRKAEAIAEYRTAMGIDPHYQEAHVDYGAALADEGRVPEAMAEYETALRINPDNPRALYNRGVALLMTGRPEDAAASFEHALRIEPNNPETHNNLGTALAKQRQWPESILEFDAAVRLDPKYAEGYRNLGEALMKTGRLHEASDALEKSIALNPGDAAAHNMLGFALATGEYLYGNHTPRNLAEAANQMREAIRLDPNLASARENLGRLLALNPATVPEAIASIEEALKLRPAPQLQQYLAQLKASQRSGR